jgi:hypothetical protein
MTVNREDTLPCDIHREVGTIVINNKVTPSHSYSKIASFNGIQKFTTVSLCFHASGVLVRIILKWVLNRTEAVDWDILA